MEKRKNNNFLKLSVAASFLFLIALVAVFVLVFRELKNKPFIIQPPVNPFSNCQEVEKDCQNNFCKYYSLCQWFASDVKSCQIYDCGLTYGLLIKDKENNASAESYTKPITEEIEKDLASCSGSVKILSQNCQNKVQKLTLEVKSGPDCPAEAFLYQQDNAWRPADFISSEQGVYLLSIPSCSEVSGIKAIGKKGMLIGEIVK